MTTTTTTTTPFAPQLFGLQPDKIPADITQRPSYYTDFAATSSANLPGPRQTPRLYVLLNRDRHPVLELKYINNIDFARERKEKECDVLGDGKKVNIEFVPHDKYPDVYKNSTNDLLEYFPKWFWLDNNLHWAPMALEMCHELSTAKNSGKTLCQDGDRDYDLVTFNQVNRRYKTKRPILHLREDGSAISGDCMPSWGYNTEIRGVPGTATVTFELAKQLEAALESKGQTTVSFELELATGLGPSKLNLTLRPGEDEHFAYIDGKPETVQNKLTFVRFFPTWYYLGDDSRWVGFDYSATSGLDASVAQGIYVGGDLERTYDLLRLLQKNNASQVIRPLFQVRGYEGFSFGGMKFATKMFPEVYARADIVLKKKDAATIKAKIADDANVSRAERILFFINGLVHEHRCAVKGGILRDAVVKKDVSMSHDIDVELPQGFSQAGLNKWVDNFTDLLKRQYNVDRDPAKNVSSRSTSDMFGPGGMRCVCEDGIITIPLLLPAASGKPEDVISIDLECVTPWNTAYSPPRNVDVSVNNLRITADCDELTLNVQFPYTPLKDAGKFKDVNAAPKPGHFFSINQIIQQIVSGECTPSYDFKWIDGTPGKTGEGISGTKWCVGNCDQSAFRTRVMDERFNKMRSKGYTMVEEPRGI